MATVHGFEGEIDLGEPANAGAPAKVDVLKAKFVRYDGCQQLTLWLPQDGYAGYERLLIRKVGGDWIEDAVITDRLNGRIQILIDTFPWPPGRYRIEITHRDGWSHELRLEKLEAGITLPQPEPPPMPKSDGEPIVYRDGTGKVLPNYDLDLRAKELARMADRFSRRLEFEGNFRAGTIIYIEGDTRLRFYHEMCGGGVHFSIDIPAADRWETETGRPLAERDDTVAFVASETQRVKARSWQYEIRADRIDFTD
ncbi:MAG: hypothetical protein RLO80_06780 [Hyphomonas sp.]